MGGWEGARERGRKRRALNSWHFRQCLSSWPPPPRPPPIPTAMGFRLSGSSPRPREPGDRLPQTSWGAFGWAVDDTEPKDCCFTRRWFGCALGLPDCADVHNTSCLDFASRSSNSSYLFPILCAWLCYKAVWRVLS